MHGQLLVGLSCRQQEHTDEFRRAGITHWAEHRRTQCADDLRQALPAVIYLWNPAKDDGSAKPAQWYRTTLSFVRAAIEDPTARVVVTCAKGLHRGPSMAYAVLRTIYDLSPEQAQAVLAAAWPTGDPWYANDIDSKFDLLAEST